MMERYAIHTESDLGIALVGSQSLARKLGFNRSQVDRLGTAVCELARNILKYAQPNGGDILIREDNDEGRMRLVVQARDNGPGMNNIDQALADHYSSSGSLGLGLPGVQRLMDHFEIISVPDAGTVVTIWLER